eukprot:TRINITY_DN75903_c0_g1_i1.p1 TRINITY_DN75903_c0_g1~~TRINITY_DN75903_c0_g1_i1.p1  ORF type:complete len:258 (-),score=78.04 TRINITY_DN75903_c0_g1_i1:334-1107(-)
MEVYDLTLNDERHSPLDEATAEPPPAAAESELDLRPPGAASDEESPCLGGAGKDSHDGENADASEAIVAGDVDLVKQDASGKAAPPPPALPLEEGEPEMTDGVPPSDAGSAEAGTAAGSPEVAGAESTASTLNEDEEKRKARAFADSFMFPHKIDRQSLQDDPSDDEEADESSEESEESESDSDEAEDTDPQPMTLPSLQEVFVSSRDSFYNTVDAVDQQLFANDEQRDLWKQRGWRAAQCCGGALLVAALIFDELD